MRLTLSCNDTNKREGIKTSYAGNIIHLLMPYATDAMNGKADDKLCNYKQALLTLLGFCQKSCNLTPRYGGIYKEHLIRRIFFKVINLSIHKDIRGRYANNREATSEDLKHQARALLDPQSEHQETAGKEGQRIKVLGLNNKGMS